MVATPNVGDRHNFLTAVTALSTTDAWSVGIWRDVSGAFGPLAMRWDGSTWNLTALAGTAHLGASPQTEGVDAAPNGDVWVVGNVTTTYPTYNLPLVLRWRGESWDVVGTVTLRPQTVYPFAARGGFLYEVDALAPDDIWAVGQAVGFGDGGATSVPLAAHWDGSSWTEVDVPRVANRHHELSDVVMISRDDVWAVGDYRNVAGAFRAVTYHWNGSAWSHVPSPIEDLPESGLTDIVATGPNDVWAIGNATNVGVVVMHWDGSRWSLSPAPANSGGSLAAVGPNDLWASGWNGFWHWDGTTWTEVPAQVPGASYAIRNGGMAIVGDCDIWCAGTWTLADGAPRYTLVERLHGVVGPPDAAPPVITNVAVSSITSTTALVTWTTNEPSNSVVDYGQTASYGSSKSDAAMVTSHSVTLTGLAANTSYHYRVASTDGAGNTATDVDRTLQTGAAVAYSASSTTVLQGSRSSGSVTSLATNNSSYYVVSSTTGGTRRTDWYGSVTVAQPPGDIVTLTLVYDGRYSRAVTQTLYLWNWTTSTWTQIDSRSVGSTDATVSSTPTAPANYVSAAGEIRLRVLGTGTNRNFTCSGDWMQFTVETTGSSLERPSLSAPPPATVAAGYVLRGNTPNPFNPSTTIQYALPREDWVRLTVYDIAGREVRQLVNGRQPAGAHTVAFDGRGLAGGVYFCVLRAGAFEARSKMTLLK